MLLKPDHVQPTALSRTVCLTHAWCRGSSRRRGTPATSRLQIAQVLVLAAAVGTTVRTQSGIGFGIPVVDSEVKELVLSIRIDPARQSRVEHIERQGAVAKQFIMETAEVEGAARRLGSSGSFSSEPLDLALPDLVRECLSWDGEVSVDLDRRIGSLETSCLHQLIHGPLAVPPERVKSRVNDQPGGTPSLGIKHPEPLRLRAEESHLVGQSLRVQSPALHEGTGAKIRPKSAEGGEVRVLRLERELEMMPGMVSWWMVVATLLKIRVPTSVVFI